MSKYERPTTAAPLHDKRKVSPKFHPLNSPTKGNVDHHLSIISFSSSRPCTIVLCPETTCAAALIACILHSDQSPPHRMIVMTENQEVLNLRFPEDLDPSYFIDFEPSSLSVLNEKCILFVDDINLFMTKSWGGLLSKHCFIFIHTRSSNSGMLTSLFNNNVSILKPLLNDNGPSLTYTINTSKMLDKQEHVNFKTSVNEGSDCDQGLGGWIKSDMLMDIGNYSPKILGLMTCILTRPFEKHIIYCPHAHGLGLELISTFLIYLKLNHVKVYTETRTKDSARSTVQAMNQDNCSILLCDVCPPHRIENIENLHIFEGIDINTLDDFLDRCYQREQYNYDSKGLTIIFHISCSRDGQMTSDEKSYSNITSIISKRRGLFKELWSKGLHIVNKNNMMVVDDK